MDGPVCLKVAARNRWLAIHLAPKCQLDSRTVNLTRITQTSRIIVAFMHVLKAALGPPAPKHKRSHIPFRSGKYISGKPLPCLLVGFLALTSEAFSNGFRMQEERQSICLEGAGWRRRLPVTGCDFFLLLVPCHSPLCKLLQCQPKAG